MELAMPEELLYGQEHGFGMQEAFPGQGFAGHHWGLQGVSEVAQEESGVEPKSAEAEPWGYPLRVGAGERAVCGISLMRRGVTVTNAMEAQAG